MFFGSIPHADLLKSVARRIVDRRVLHLIKMWLEGPVEETDQRGRTTRTTAARDSRRGRSPAGEWVRSFAIVTTTPNDLCAELHNRMPVVLGRQVWPEWLGEEPADLPRLKALLAPYPAEEMTCWPVSTRVGSVKSNDPSLIEPVALAT
jgi:putative SOS response-associated peptidase YedK